MKNPLYSLSKFILGITLLSVGFQESGFAAPKDRSLVGVNTSGTIYEIDKDTGTLTQIATEEVTGVSLGATARKNNTLYYVAAPSGTSENSIYSVNLKLGVISHVDLDRSLGDDEVRSLFFKGAKLYGVFYNGNAGTAGVYRINPRNGVTKLILNLSDLNVEPLPGAFARLRGFYYLLAKPEVDSTVRKLIRFRISARSSKEIDIVDKDGAPVLCERFKVDSKNKRFVCLAAPSTTQVDICSLTVTGRSKCYSTLTGIERVAGGHTMVTPNGKEFQAFVYATGDSDTQRLITFNAKGVVKTTATIDSIIVGARYGKDLGEND